MNLLVDGPANVAVDRIMLQYKIGHPAYGSTDQDVPTTQQFTRQHIDPPPAHVIKQLIKRPTNPSDQPTDQLTNYSTNEPTTNRPIIGNHDTTNQSRATN